MRPAERLSSAGFSGPSHYEATLDGQSPTERLVSLEANYPQLMGVTGPPYDIARMPVGTVHSICRRTPSDRLLAR